MSAIKSNDSGIHARVVILCLISAAGIYLSITRHALILGVFVLNAASLLFLNEEEAFWQMLFLLPFTTIYKYSPASSSLFTYLNLVVAVRLLIKNFAFSQKFLTLLVLFIFVTLIGIQNALISFIKIISNVFLLVLFTKVVRRETFPKMILSISLGEVISSFIGMRKTTWSALAAFYYSLKEEYIGGELVARFCGLYVDPNYYSIMVIVCLYGLLLYMYKKEISYKAGIPLFIALIYFGCMTYSRVFYISLACIMLAILAIRFKNKSIAGTLLLTVVCGGIFLYFADKNGIIDNIMYRFNADDVSNGRFSILSSYLKKIAEDTKIIFIGAGLGADLRGLGSAHNFYIETVYHVGIIGAVLYFYLLYTIMTTRTYPLFKRSVINLGLTAVLMFMFATLGMLFQFDFIYIMMMDWMILNTDVKRISATAPEESNEVNV